MDPLNENPAHEEPGGLRSRYYRRPRIRVAVRVAVIPPQRPGLLGPDPGGQGQDHVGAETVASDLWADDRTR